MTPTPAQFICSVRFLLTFILIFSLSTTLMAQKEANVWWFGTKSGLDFNTTPPTYLDSKPINTYEGSSTICDPVTGALIFATDGQSVWYPNGTTVTGGTGLRGASSSAQSALIVPNPSNSNQWFIFTSNVDPGTGTPYGTNYYTVNRAGSVLTVGAVTNLLGASASTEQLCALGDGANGYWVITHGTDGSGVGVGAGSNAIHAFHVSSAGVVTTTPVTSNVGHAMKSYQGLMKTNSCQTQIAATYLSEATTEVYNFNNTTGTVTGLACSIGGLSQPYGLEFSPNDLYLYHGTLGGTMYQLTVATCANANTGWAYPPNGSVRFGQMQLGPDGRIYVSNECTGSSCYLGVISTPNNPFATAGWNSTAIPSPTPNTLGYPQLGLPTFSRTFVSGVLTPFPASGTYCINTNIPLSYSFSGPVTSQTWTVTPATGWSFTSGTNTDPSPTIRFTTAGAYNIKLDVVSCSRTYTKNISITIVNISSTTGTITCSPPSSIILTSPDPNAIWYDAASGGNVIGIGSPVTLNYGSDLTSPGTVWVDIANSASSTVTGTNTIVGPAPDWLNGSSYVYSTRFNVLSDHGKLNSFVIEPRAWPGACPAFISLSFTVEIRNASNTLIYSLPYTAPANTYSCNSPITIPVGADLVRGNGYTISLASFTSNASAWYQIYNGFPVTVANVATNTGPASNYTIMGNLNFTSNNYTITPGCATRTAVTKACSLPVEWVSVDAKRTGTHSVFVSWAVAMELFNERFEIQRSLDGVNFSTIGTVKGRGTSSSYKEYNFTDSSVPFGVNVYYRVVQFDIDGKSSASSIVVVAPQGDTTNIISIYPNPSVNVFNIEWYAETDAEYQVFDVRGVVVASGELKASNGAQTIGSNFTEGIYIVKVYASNQTFNLKLIKQ